MSPLTRTAPQGVAPLVNPFCTGYDVWFDIKIFSSKSRSKTPYPSDDLIKNKQEVVLSTNFSKSLQVPNRWDYSPSRTSNWLNNYCSYIICRMLCNQIEQWFCSFCSTRWGHPSGEGILADIQCMRQMDQLQTLRKYRSFCSSLSPLIWV
jgi:hypothetical protein